MTDLEALGEKLLADAMAENAALAVAEPVHLTPARLVALGGGRSQLQQEEAEHLRECSECSATYRKWKETPTELLPKVGRGIPDPTYGKQPGTSRGYTNFPSDADGNPVCPHAWFTAGRHRDAEGSLVYPSGRFYAPEVPSETDSLIRRCWAEAIDQLERGLPVERLTYGAPDA